MAASIEHQLLCKIIETGDFNTVEKMRINEGFFLGGHTSYQEIFRAISIHFHNQWTINTTPSWQLISTWFPGFAWIGSKDSVAALCLELKKAKLRAQVIGLADEITLKADVSPADALVTIKEAATRLHTEHEISSDILMTSAYDTLRNEYNIVQQSGGITGIPYPPSWSLLNEDTQGIHDEDYIIIYGRPKSMKSWVAFYIGALAYYWSRMRVLIWSMEMSKLQCLRRCACIIASVDYTRVKNAKLDPATEAEFFNTLWWLGEQEKQYPNQTTGRPGALLIVSPQEAQMAGGVGVTALQAKIREFEPDLVIADGIYLMGDDRDQRKTMDWKAVAHISQDLKGTTKAYKVPIIATTQANRSAKNPNDKEADLSELAYADALAQDCDMAMRVHKQPLKETNETELILSIPGSREGKLDGFVIYGEPATNFSQKRREMKDPNAPPEEDKKRGRPADAPPVTRAVPQLPNWRKP